MTKAQHERIVREGDELGIAFLLTSVASNQTKDTGHAKDAIRSESDGVLQRNQHSLIIDVRCSHRSPRANLWASS